MKSITSKISIIMLSLLASTFTFAFGHGEVCAAMNEAVTESANTDSPIFYGPIYDIESRKTAGSDPRGEVCGSIANASGRICGQSGLECSGDTCHVNKKWADCGCTSGACTDATDAESNLIDG